MDVQAGLCQTWSEPKLFSHALCVRPGRNPNCLFSHAQAKMIVCKTTKLSCLSVCRKERLLFLSLFEMIMLWKCKMIFLHYRSINVLHIWYKWLALIDSLTSRLQSVKIV